MVGVFIPLQLYHTTRGGTTNRVADCLSHYYEMNGPGDKHPDHEFVSTDAWLNPDGELLPVRRYIEVRAAAAR